jgi:hypothetical protein
MDRVVAPSAEGNQIFGRVIPQLTSRLDVMDLHCLDRAAGLAAPAVSLKDFAAESAVCFGIKP